MTELAGVTLMETSVAGLTVSAAVPLMPVPLSRAVMVVTLAAATSAPVANPWEPAALEMVAAEILLEDQVTLAVRSAVAPLS